MSSRTRIQKKSSVLAVILTVLILGGGAYAAVRFLPGVIVPLTSASTGEHIVITDTPAGDIAAPGSSGAISATPASSSGLFTASPSVAATLIIPSEQGTVTIGSTKITVNVSSTTPEIDQGLQYRTSLTADQGMLFLFNHSAIFRFWMPNMNFPLDMIWIGSDMQVVDITKDAPPLADTSKPVWFSPTTPAQYVLEVNAGFADAHGIQTGDTVSFDLPQ